MVTYDLMLERQRLIGAERFSVAANANKTVFLRFHFDRSWRRFDSKAAVFRNSASKYYIIEIIENRAKVPWEVLTEKGEFELSVIGFEGEKVITSDKVEIIVSESLMPEDCLLLDPSEVLFDRFKRECTAQAYLDYENEINELKRAHIEEKLALGAKINEANERTDNVLKEKNEEIKELEASHNIETIALNRRISELDEAVAFYKEKADKWDMVDHALGLKTSFSSSLWSGSLQDFYLPMLNTSSIVAFPVGGISQKLKSVGFDLSSATSFASIFAAHENIESLELKNTHNITSFANLVESCKTIKHITIDSMKSCASLARFANEATMLQTISFGTEVRAESFDRAFRNCVVLKEIHGSLNLGFASSTTTMFYNCTSLEKVRFVENSIRTNMDFVYCINLSKESMISIFEGLSPQATGLLAISAYAFENNFSEEERSEWTDFITNTKGWELELD